MDCPQASPSLSRYGGASPVRLLLFVLTQKVNNTKGIPSGKSQGYKLNPKYAIEFLLRL